jgi:sulfur-carrier protein
MTVTVLLPIPLQKFNSDKAIVECAGNNVVELLDALEVSCPGIKTKMCREDNGQLRGFLNLYINGQDIRFLNGHDTSLKDSDRVVIEPAMLPLP